MTVQQQEMRLNIDASAAKKGAREAVGAIATIKAAMKGLERQADGTFNALRKGLQVAPAKGAESALTGTTKAAKQTEAAAQRLATSVKNSMTTATLQISKVKDQFAAVGDQNGIRKAEQALARFQARAEKAGSAAALGSVKADHRATVTGLQAEARAQEEAASAAAKRAATTEALRKRHDEMFAVSKRYEASLEEIAALERAGALTAEKAAAARTRAAQQLAAGAVATGKYGQALKVNQFHVTNFNNVIDDMGGKARRVDLRQVMLQLSQVGQQGAVTGNYLQALAIQLPDFALGFGPVGIAAGAVAGILGSTLIGMMTKTGKESEKLKNQVHALSTALDGLAQYSSASAGQIEAHLTKTFEGTAASVQALIEDLREAEFSVLSNKMRREVEKAASSLNSLGGAFEAYWENFANPGSVDSGYLRQMTEIIAKSKVSYGEFQKLETAVSSVFRSQDVNEFVANLSKARATAQEIGGPVGSQIEKALLQAAKDGGVLNRVMSDAASGASDFATELSEGARQALALADVDMSKGISDATKEAAELAAQLNLSLTAAYNLKQLQDSKVYSGRGGDPRQFGKGYTPPSLSKVRTGGAPQMSDLQRTTQQIEAQNIALKALQSGLFETSTAASAYAQAMQAGGGAVDKATMAALKQADAVAHANEQLRKIVQNNRSGGLREATEAGIKGGAKQGLSAAMQSGDIRAFAEAMRSSVFTSISDAIADAWVESIFSKTASGGGWLSTVGSFFGFSEGGYSDQPGMTKHKVPLAAFKNAPQYAEGTANTSSGIPAILHPNEAVVPLSRGRKIPVDLGDGKGGKGETTLNVVNNINVDGGDEDSELAVKIAQQVGETIEGIIDTRVAESAQYGGALNPRGGR